MISFLYGPPGSGKSTIGKQLAKNLELPFIDLDELIEQQSGLQIPEIFAIEGETGFRERESSALTQALALKQGVVALGGGALLHQENRARVEAAGRVICLNAPLETLYKRLWEADTKRPLLADQSEAAFEIPAGMRTRLQDLLSARSEHYASFPLQLNTDGSSIEEAVQQLQLRLGVFRVQGMGPGYDVRVTSKGLDMLGAAMQERGLRGPIALVSDENVGALYAQQAIKALKSSGYEVRTILIPPGEAYKTIRTIGALWEGFLEAGLERSSTVVVLGGGVVGDLAGFAAATYLRGIAWVVLPTSLLAMVDASIGGKTGADLPQGKNLVGSFHPPKFVLADPQTLKTLPRAELRSGMAEVVKAGVIGDPELFDHCSQGWGSVESDWDGIIRRAMAVKIAVIQEDPYEKGKRASLNLGHTIGHALEKVSGYQLRHGEAVAIGMVVEAKLAEAIGVAETPIAAEIEKALWKLNLPTKIPEDLDRRSILSVMQVDKKKSGGQIRFALPVRIGKVRFGTNVENIEILIQNF